MKVCNKCGSNDLSRPNAPYCRKCRKEIDRNYYLNNKKLVRQKRKADRDRFVAWLNSLKDNKPCTDCGNIFRWWVLQWDHLPQYKKDFNISEVRSKQYSKDKVLKEVAKCELVCANCHSDRTHNRRAGLV